MLPLPNTKDGSCSLKPNEAGVESLGVMGALGTRGWAGQERSRAGWTWEAAVSHIHTLRVETGH